MASKYNIKDKFINKKGTILEIIDIVEQGDINWYRVYCSDWDAINHTGILAEDQIDDKFVKFNNGSSILYGGSDVKKD